MLYIVNDVCCDNPEVRKDLGNGCYVCVNCGQCSGQVFCPFESYVVNRYDYRKRKSVHSRTRWFRNMLMDYVYDDRDRDMLNADFMKLVRCYEKHGLLKGRNMSIYGWYIIKLAKRRGIPLTRKPRDIKTPAIRREYNRRYNKALQLLQWKPREICKAII